MRLRYTSVLVLAVLMALAGCKNDPTIWRSDLHSPDDAWIATARTEQFGGFGSAGMQTTVSLSRINKTVNSGKPFDVLEFDNGASGYPVQNYVLSDANAGGGVDLKMHWLSPSHLEVTYDGSAEPDLLQVVKYAGVDISLKLVPKADPDNKSNVSSSLVLSPK